MSRERRIMKSGDLAWEYMDEEGHKRGPFSSHMMRKWYLKGYLAKNLLVRKIGSQKFAPLYTFGRNPFPVSPVVSPRTQARTLQGLRWYYLDEHRKVQGPFTSNTMRKWFKKKYLLPTLRVRCDNHGEMGRYYLLRNLGEEPFRCDPRVTEMQKREAHIRRSKQYCYKDDNGDIQGPFPQHKMRKWLSRGLLREDLMVALAGTSEFKPLKEYGANPFSSKSGELPPRVRMHHPDEPHPPLWHDEKRKSVPRSDELARMVSNMSVAEKAQAEKDLKSRETKAAEEDRIAREKKAQAEKDRIAQEKKAEEDRVAREKKAQAEKDRIAREKKAEEDRVAREKKAQAEKDRIAREKKAEEDRIAREKKAQAEKDRIAREKKAEEDRIAREKKAQAEKDRIAREKKALAEKDRIAREKKAEEDRIAREKKAQAEKDRIAREKKAEEDRIARERKVQAEKDRIAREKKAKEDRIAREKKAQAEKDRIAREKKAEEDRIAREKKEKAERDRVAREKKAEEDRIVREKKEKAERDRVAREKKEKEDQIAREKKAQAEKDRIAREKKAEEDRIAREKKEKAERDRVAREKKAEEDRIAREKKESADASVAAATKKSATPKKTSPVARSGSIVHDGSVLIDYPYYPEGESGPPKAISAKQKKLMKKWCKWITDGYPGAKVKGWKSKSWTNGLAFAAMVATVLPDKIDYNNLKEHHTPLERLQAAFAVAEEELGVEPILDPKLDIVDMPTIDQMSLILFLTMLQPAVDKKMYLNAQDGIAAAKPKQTSSSTSTPTKPTVKTTAKALAKSALEDDKHPMSQKHKADYKALHVWSGDLSVYQDDKSSWKKFVVEVTTVGINEFADAASLKQHHMSGSLAMADVEGVVLFSEKDNDKRKRKWPKQRAPSAPTGSTPVLVTTSQGHSNWFCTTSDSIARRFVSAIHNAVAWRDAFLVESMAHDYSIVQGDLKWQTIDFSAGEDVLEPIRCRMRKHLENNGTFLFRFHDAAASKLAARAKRRKPAKGKQRQKELVQWIERTLDKPLEGGFVEGLKSGVVLCNLANKLAQDNGIKPKKGKKIIRKIKKSKMKFDMLENCGHFVEAARTIFGIRQEATPSPNDITSGKTRQLEICLTTLERKFDTKETSDDVPAKKKIQGASSKTAPKKTDNALDGYSWAELPIPRPKAARVYGCHAHEGPKDSKKESDPKKEAEVFKDIVRKLPEKEWREEVANFAERRRHQFVAKLRAVESVLHDKAAVCVMRVQDPVYKDNVQPAKWGDCVIIFSPASAHALDDAALKQPATLGPLEKFLQSGTPPLILGSNVRLDGSSPDQDKDARLNYVKVTNKLFLHTKKEGMHPFDRKF